MAARPLALADPKIPLQGKIEKNAVRGKTFFQVLRSGAIGTGICNPMPSSPLRPLALAAHCGHLRPLAATCSSSPLRPLAATCGHLRPLEWLQVAAFLKFKYRAFCNLNGTCYKSHLRRNRICIHYARLAPHVALQRCSPKYKTHLLVGRQRAAR